MTTIRKRFPLQYLQDLGLPDECEGGEVVRDTITNKRRWSIDHSLVVRLPGQGPDEAWAMFYSVGATENQHERPWEGRTEVDAILVHRIPVTADAWWDGEQPAPHRLPSQRDMGLELGRLRHLYQQMLTGDVQNTAKAARDVLGPAIAVLERIALAMNGQEPPAT